MHIDSITYKKLSAFQFLFGLVAWPKDKFAWQKSLWHCEDAALFVYIWEGVVNPPIPHPHFLIELPPDKWFQVGIYRASSPKSNTHWMVPQGQINASRLKRKRKVSLLAIRYFLQSQWLLRGYWLAKQQTFSSNADHLGFLNRSQWKCELRSDV